MQNLILTILGAIVLVGALGAALFLGAYVEAGGTFGPDCHDPQVTVATGPGYTAPYICVDAEDVTLYVQD